MVYVELRDLRAPAHASYVRFIIGNKNRSVGATLMNADSSRSHSIFTINIETSEPVEASTEERIRAGKLNLVSDGGDGGRCRVSALHGVA